MSDYAGKVVVVTGAGTGIGAAVVHRFVTGVNLLVDGGLSAFNGQPRLA